MILYLVEHPGREMHIARKLSKRIADIFGDEVIVANINFINYDIFTLRDIRLIIVPGPNPVINVIRAVNDSPLLLLNYEQMLSEINRKLKKTKLELGVLDISVACSDEYKQYLFEQGILHDSIILTDRPQNEIALDMCFVPTEMDTFLKAVPEYSQFKSLVFVPLTCLQAFKSHAELRRLSEYSGVDFLQLCKRKEFVRVTLLSYYQYLCEQRDNCIYILRPHPSITPDMHYQFIKEANLTLPSNVLVTDEFSPYQWIARANLLITNYSSLSLDAAWLGCPVALVNPLNMPQFMRYEWFRDFREFSFFSKAIDTAGPGTTMSSKGNYSKFTYHLLEALEVNADKYQYCYDSNFLRRPFSIFNRRLIANLYRRIRIFLNKELKTGIYADYFDTYLIKRDS